MQDRLITWMVCCGIAFGLLGCGPTLEERQKKSQMQYEIGAAELNRGNLTEAFAAFERAREIDPNNASVHYGLGVIYLQQKQYEKAIAEFQETLRLDPNLTEAHNNLGSTYAQMHRWDEAIAEFKNAADDPFYRTPELAYYNIGAALMEKGDLIEAVQQLHKAVQIRPDFTRALDKYGVALFRLNRVQEAVKQFKQATELDPNFIEPYLNLGLAYMKQGKKDDAIANFKIVTERSNDASLVESAKRYLDVLQ